MDDRLSYSLRCKARMASSSPQLIFQGHFFRYPGSEPRSSFLYPAYRATRTLLSTVRCLSTRGCSSEFVMDCVSSMIHSIPPLVSMNASRRPHPTIGSLTPCSSQSPLFLRFLRGGWSLRASSAVRFAGDLSDERTGMGSRAKLSAVWMSISGARVKFVNIRTFILGSD
jgi:hypothetical protein